jgi:GNAT superfamily N-acetyltransferase
MTSITIEIASPQEYETIEKMAEEWEMIAAKKKQQARTPQERELFSNSMTIAQLISEYFHIERRVKSEIYVCKDQKKALQGVCIVLIGKEDLYVELVATHPHQLRSSLHQAQRIHGIGTALMRYAETRAAVLACKTISLTSLDDGADGFFKKLGFRAHPDEINMAKEVSRA